MTCLGGEGRDRKVCIRRRNLEKRNVKLESSGKALEREFLSWSLKNELNLDQPKVNKKRQDKNQRTYEQVGLSPKYFLHKKLIETC